MGREIRYMPMELILNKRIMCLLDRTVYLHLEYFFILLQYYSSHQIMTNDMGWACDMYGGTVGTYRYLVGKPEGKR